MNAHNRAPPGAKAAPSTTIVAAVGDAEVGRLVVATALRIARAWPGSRLHLVRVLEAPALAATLAGKLYGFERRRLALYARPPHGAPLVTTHLHLLFGEIIASLSRLIERVEAHVVIMGTHDTASAVGRAFGSVAGAFLRNAPCPMLMVRPRRPGAFESCGGSTCAGCPQLRRAHSDAALPCAGPGLRGAGCAS